MKTGIFDSWEVIDENVAIKNTELSFFKYNGSGISKAVRESFDV